MSQATSPTKPELHLGLTPWDFSTITAQSLSAQAAFAESCGYQSFWLPENHFGSNALPEPMLLLASVAANTTCLSLGTTSYLLPLRNPLLAAEQVAVLDQLSQGRVILGVGRGYSKETLNAFNIQPGTKRQLFEWCLGKMQDAWSGLPVSLHDDGTSAVVVAPLPFQQPHPPVWVAAFGPKALAQAGRLGLPYLASPIETFAQLCANYAAHDQAIEDSGQTAPAARPIMRSIFVSDKPDELKTIRSQLQQTKPPRGLETAANIDDWAIIGEPAYVKDQVEAYREALGATHLIVTRLRITDLEDVDFKSSVARLAELFL